MNRKLLLHAFDYKQWADLRTLETIAQLYEKKAGDPIAFILQQLNHMVIVEELFRARLLGFEEPHHSTNTESVPSLEELSRRITLSDDWFLDFSSKVDEALLEKSVHFQFMDGQNGSMTVLEILFHIINHGAYHRGAIGHSLNLAHVPRPADTYTVYVHSVEPERRKRGSD
jgi:uncharacterized damage-inducible protein DinB